MKKLKDLKKLLIMAVIVLMIIALLFIIFSTKKVSLNSGENNQLKNLPIKDAKAQSYAATQTLSLKVDDKVFGNKDAKLKIFVYEDNSNLYSAKLADTLDKLYSEVPSKIAIIVRPFISNSDSISKESALAVECAGQQNKWVPMRALLFAKAKNSSLNFANFGEYAAQVGLDEKAFSTCLTNSQKSAKIEELNKEAQAYNIYGAPTIFIADEMILGARPYEDYVDSNGDSIEGLKTLIDKKMK